PLGHWPDEHGSTQYLAPLSLAHCQERQSTAAVQGAPRPATTPGPETQRPPTQVSPSPGQSAAFLQPGPTMTWTRARPAAPATSDAVASIVWVPSASASGPLATNGVAASVLTSAPSTRSSSDDT